MAELGNPKNTIEVLQKYQFHFAKKFGQNFLIDTHVLDKIVRAAEITPEDYVLEIGPGKMCIRDSTHTDQIHKAAYDTIYNRADSSCFNWLFCFACVVTDKRKP